MSHIKEPEITETFLVMMWEVNNDLRKCHQFLEIGWWPPKLTFAITTTFKTLVGCCLFSLINPGESSKELRKKTRVSNKNKSKKRKRTKVRRPMSCMKSKEDHEKLHGISTRGYFMTYERNWLMRLLFYIPSCRLYLAKSCGCVSFSLPKNLA